MSKFFLTSFAFVLLMISAIACGSATSENASPGQKGDFDKQFTTDSIIQIFKTAGIPIGEVKTYDASSDPNHLLGRPGQYVAKAKWGDQRVKPAYAEAEPKGGDVEIFDSEKAMEQRWKYLGGFSDSSLLGFYMYKGGNAIVRIEHDLTPDQAAQYEAVLKEASQ